MVSVLKHIRFIYVTDVAIGAPFENAKRCTVYIYSIAGRSAGKILQKIEAPQDILSFGYSFATITTADKDCRGIYIFPAYYSQKNYGHSVGFPVKCVRSDKRFRKREKTCIYKITFGTSYFIMYLRNVVYIFLYFI